MNVTTTAQEIAKISNGTLIGSGAHPISQINNIEELKENTFCFLLNKKYEKYIYKSSERVILVNSLFEPKYKTTNTYIKVDDVQAVFHKILSHFSQNSKTNKGIKSSSVEINPSAQLKDPVQVDAYTVICANAKIDEGTHIASQVYIGKNVIIGRHCKIHSGVKIYDHTVIGSHVIIHANSVIGSDGFGFEPSTVGWKKIPQIGNVVIEDNVEIGACVTIDRARIGSTIIKSGTKLDNLIHIAHNVRVGQNVVIAAQSGIAGSTNIGKNSMIGGQVGISGHLKVAEGSQIQAKSGVASSIKQKNKKWYGYPILPFHSYLRSFAIFKKLPALAKKIDRIDRLLKEKDIES